MKAEAVEDNLPACAVMIAGAASILVVMSVIGRVAGPIWNS
jgi:hypothetical protein